MTEEVHNAAHRDLVKALGDEIALADSTGGWLESAEWAEAIDRCAARFPHVPRDEAFRLVGQLLGRRYLASETGKVVLQSLKLVPKDRVFSNLVPAMAVRLRPGFTWDWEPGATGGTLRVGGPRATPATVTLGFFEMMVRELQPPAAITLGKVDPNEFELLVSW